MQFPTLRGIILATIALAWPASMHGVSYGAAATRKPVQPQALQLSTVDALPTPAPVTKAINCLDSTDIEAVRPKSKLKAGMVNGKARALPGPALPPELRLAGVCGTVVVEIVIDALEGKVIRVRAMSGPPPLRAASMKAACRARFFPANINSSRSTLRVSGLLAYRFPPLEKIRPASPKKRTRRALTGRQRA